MHDPFRAADGQSKVEVDQTDEPQVAEPVYDGFDEDQFGGGSADDHGGGVVCGVIVIAVTQVLASPCAEPMENMVVVFMWDSISFGLCFAYLRMPSLVRSVSCLVFHRGLNRSGDIVGKQTALLPRWWFATFTCRSLMFHSGGKTMMCLNTTESLAKSFEGRASHSRSMTLVSSRGTVNLTVEILLLSFFLFFLLMDCAVGAGAADEAISTASPRFTHCFCKVYIRYDGLIKS